MKNSEGYYDPTAGRAMSSAMKDYKKLQKDKWLKEQERKRPKMVYVISPYAGNVRANVANAIDYCRYVIAEGYMPVASHLLYPQMLNDDIPEERALGTSFGMALLSGCQEAWVFGEHISKGMGAELDECKKLHIPIRYLKEEDYADFSSRRSK